MKATEETTNMETSRKARIAGGEGTEKAISYFGELEGDFVFAYTVPTNVGHIPGCGIPLPDGGTLHPENCARDTGKRRIIFDHDKDYPLMLVRVYDIDPKKAARNALSASDKSHPVIS